MTYPYLKPSKLDSAIIGAVVAIVFWNLLLVFIYRLTAGPQTSFPTGYAIILTILGLFHGSLTGLAISVLDFGKFGGGVASLVMYNTVWLVTGLIGAIYRYYSDPSLHDRGFQLFFGEFLGGLGAFLFMTSIWTLIPAFLVGFLTSAVANIAKDKRNGTL